MADNRELERTLIEASVEDNSKYAGINKTSQGRFTVGGLQRRARGEGDYFVLVYD